MKQTTALLDTNIVIDLLGGVHAAYAGLLVYKDLAISRIVWIEVLAGLRAAEKPFIESVFRKMIVLEVSAEIAARTVELRRTTRLKLADAIIYATAQVHGMTLITRNSRDFTGDMPGVHIPYTV